MLFKNLSLAVVLNLLIKPIWVIQENIIQNKIGHESFGLFSALSSLGFIFLIFTDLGINYSVTQEIAQKTENDFKSILSKTFLLKIILNFTFPLLVVTIGFFFGYSKYQLFLLLMLAGAQSFLQLILFFKAVFQGRQNFFVDVIAGVLDKLLLIILLSIVLLGNISLNELVITRLLSAFLAFLVLFFFVKKLYGKIDWSIDSSFVKKMWTLSWPFAIISLLNAFNDKVDQVLLERIAGDMETGLYSAAYRWVDIAMMYIWTIMPVFFARFAFLKNDAAKTENLFKSGMVISSIPLIFVCVFCFFYGEKFFWLFTNSTELEISKMTFLLQILFTSVLLQSFFVMFSTYLNSTGHVKLVSKLVFVSVLMNIILNIIFIPKYGAIASAVITALCSLLFSLAAFACTWILAKNLIFKTLLLKLALIALFVFGMFYLLNLTGSSWIITSGVSLIGVILLCYYFKLFNLLKLNV